MSKKRQYPTAKNGTISTVSISKKYNIGIAILKKKLVEHEIIHIVGRKSILKNFEFAMNVSRVHGVGIMFYQNKIKELLELLKLSPVPDGEEYCTVCEIIYPSSNFNKGKAHCKNCQAIYNLEQRAKRSEKNIRGVKIKKIDKKYLVRGEISLCR